MKGVYLYTMNRLYFGGLKQEKKQEKKNSYNPSESL